MDGSVMRCALSNCGTPMTIASGLYAPYGIAVDATNVYWVSDLGGGFGGLMKCPIGGCASAPTMLATQNGLYLVVDGSNVYWAGGSLEIDRVALTGGTTTAVATGLSGGVGRIAQDATAIYWTGGWFGGGTIDTVMKLAK
jgi:hypothetical protein